MLKICFLWSYYKENSFNSRAYGECVEFYPGTNIRRHASPHNNPEDCLAEAGNQWIDFYNYIDKDASE